MTKIAIVGTGGMGSHHARVFQALADCKLVAVCGPDLSRVARFASQFGVPGAHTDLADMLAQVDVDALVIASPDLFHASLSLQGIAAEKHIFCEKPLAMDYLQAKAMAVSAQKAGVINMVNFSYRQSGALHRARQMVKEGALGNIIHVEASHLQSWLSSRAWGDWRTDSALLRKLSVKHGSQGALGDLAGHLFDFVSFVVGDFESVQCRTGKFGKKVNNTVCNQVGDYTLDADDSAVIMASFRNGALGVLSMSRWASGHINRVYLSVHGDKGALRINLEHGNDALEVCLGDDVDTGSWQSVEAEAVPSNQQRFIAGIQTGKAVQPDFARGAAIQKVIDACFASAQESPCRQV